MNAQPNQAGMKAKVSFMAEDFFLISTALTRDAYRKNAIAPPIMECASTAAYCFPFFETVSASVASATEGAAPKRPAKLFGENSPPRNENTATTAPPIKNLRRSSVNLSASFVIEIRRRPRLDSHPANTNRTPGD